MDIETREAVLEAPFLWRQHDVAEEGKGNVADLECTNPAGVEYAVAGEGEVQGDYDLG